MNNLEIALPKEYEVILNKVKDALPLATADAENFNKASSQFKLATLDVADLTPINSAKHLLAVIQKTKQALEQASIDLRRKQLELKRKESNLMAAEGIELESLIIDIDELKIQIQSLENAGRGAMRKLANALDQYESILKGLNKNHLTELDYEEDQKRFHIMTAFNQALTAARARGGLIDEGNFIYLFQLGINGAMAQCEITQLLEAEQIALREGKVPTHEGTIKWLQALADKYLDSSEKYTETRFMKILNKEILMEGQK